MRSGTGSSLATCGTLAATAAGLATSAGLRAFALLGVVQLGLAVIPLWPATPRHASTSSSAGSLRGEPVTGMRLLGWEGVLPLSVVTTVVTAPAAADVERLLTCAVLTRV